MTSLIGKARRPKFDLHLKIYDLNNVPLVQGSSFIKWHLAHSMHAEHRGRTSKCPIANHRVDYVFSKRVPHIRISVDRTNNLAECPLELEIVQEFAVAEKITLGHVKLNLSEYVEESEAFLKEQGPGSRKHSTSAEGASPTTGQKLGGALGIHHIVDDGIVRRYLMQDSKVNSTLKIGILMVQVDGDRNYIAPPLRTAPVFGGIAGLIAPEVGEDEGPVPSISKPRDASDVQDLYRRTLAASWSRQPSELPADECIEDIFAGGNGWRTRSDDSPASEDDADAHHGTLRPRDFRRLAQQQQQQHRHRRTHSGSSDKSISTVTGRNGNGGGRRTVRLPREDTRSSGGGTDDDPSRSRSDSLASLTPTLGSDRSRGDVVGYRNQREVSEGEAREDMVAWRLPGGVAA